MVPSTAVAVADHIGLDPARVESIFSVVLRNVPRADAEDLEHDVAIRVLLATPSSDSAVYTIAKRGVATYFRELRRGRRRALGVVAAGSARDPADSEVPQPTHHSRRLAEGHISPAMTRPSLGAAAGSVPRASQDVGEWVAAKLDAAAELARIPRDIVDIGLKRFAGWPLVDSERQRLSRWRRSKRTDLVS